MAIDSKSNGGNSMIARKQDIRFLGPELCKSWKNYGRMRNVCGKASFCQKTPKNYSNVVKMGVQQRNKLEKDWVKENTDYPVRKRFWNRVLIKMVMMRVSWNIKESIFIDFLKIDGIVKDGSNWNLRRQYSRNLHNNTHTHTHTHTHIYIYIYIYIYICKFNRALAYTQHCLESVSFSTSS